MRSYSVAVSMLVALAASSLAQPQDDPSIMIAGRIESRRLAIRLSDLAQLPKKTVQVKLKNATTTFEGVTLQSVLELAGVLFGPKLLGARLMAFVAVEGPPPTLQELNSQEPAEDDYRALFSLAELDDTISSRSVILAITQDGKPLGKNDGPFRLIAPGDQRRSRWIKSVNTIWVLHADTILGGGGPLR
jgi:hypothetical protein